MLDAIGLTPMVRLNRVTAGIGAAVYGKVEYLNPSGSLKDRILRFMVEDAERRGELKPGMTIIEGTTGNTGIATSMIGAIKGYPVLIVMPRGMSAERRKTMWAYGAEIVLTEGAESDVDLVMDKVQEIKAANPGRMWEVGQFTNLNNVEAHYRTTAAEIWDQMDGEIGAFVASQGTGGTVTGVARYFRERNPEVKIYAVEPAECPILSGGDWGTHSIEGIGDGFIPDVLDIDLLDGVIQTTSAESVEMAQRLAREEGIFCGISSGCNVAAALKLARKHPELKSVVTMINDNGLRYFSTELCGENPEVHVPDREHFVREEDRARLAGKVLDVII
ncbi:MAG: cysteine synthase A [Firmicutes bacterium]|nr:cysteine synthase A [Bacillota bacterium]